MKIKKSFLYIMMILFLLPLFLTSCIDSQSKESDKEAPAKEVEKEKYYAVFTGEEIESDEQNNNRPFAVMLNNHPDALPQAGLADCDILYEYKVEGEYTRYLAIFQSKFPDVNIGSVRSARPYFVDTAKELNAIYCHWGGSPEGYSEIPKIGVDDLDGIALEGITYFRNKEVNKKRPHDGYTTFANLKEAAEKKNFTLSSENEFFKFDHTDDKEELNKMESIEVPSVTLNFFKHYKEEIMYNPKTDKYVIVRNGENIIDENSKEDFTPSNIIISYANSKVTGANGTLTIYNIGEGSGLLLTNGKLVEINWSKPDASSRTIYTQKDGSEIYLNPGQTLIATIDDNEGSVVYENPEENAESSNANNANSTNNAK
ncbi:DUF3048 domain-containing protein [Peptoniphilus sp.]|jgi:hypothetical protein|uniref:DUF3048 domain-containing protein n=1 Tax=Peptoniphilus sp. TaxID=1971214 RepID=UPI003D912E1D